MNALAERTMPHNLEAERSVLGAVLMDNSVLAEACEHLAVGSFYRHAHNSIFARMVALAERRAVIDLVTLREELGDDLDEVGGPAYITSLIDGMPRGANVGDYARIVKEKAQLRQLIAAGNRLLTKAFEADEPAADILEEAEKTVLGLAEGTVSSGFESMRSIASRMMQTLETIGQTKQGVTGVPSGFVDLDELTRGFQPGTLVIIGARPGMGKTSLAINIAQHAAAAGRVVGVFSLEMTKDELFVRQLAAEARIDSHRLQSGYVGSHEWSRIAAAFETIAASSIHVDETPGIGVFEIRSRARRLRAEHGLDLIIIDYLQLMGARERRDSNRALELGAITSALKGLSKELKIPIVALSQLSRETEKRERDHRPRLADLRESGSIEQDADIVLFIYRPEVYEEVTDENRGVAEIIVGKHRNGPVGTVKLSWFEQQTRFDNYAPAATQPEDQRLPMGSR